MSSVSSIPSVRKYDVISFEYPEHNRHSVQTVYKTRRLVVESWRDCFEFPVQTDSYSAEPDVCRGQWLLVGHDLDRYAIRSFYVDSMRDIRKIDVQLLRAARYDPCDDSKFIWKGPVVTTSSFDVAQITQSIIEQRHSREPTKDSHLPLGLFEFPTSRSL